MATAALLRLGHGEASALGNPTDIFSHSLGTTWQWAIPVDRKG